MVWRGDLVKARTAVATAAEDAVEPSRFLRRLGRTLSQTRGVNAVDLAVHCFDQWSGGVQAGSADWHDAKTGGISALIVGGRPEDARRRIDYLLLTRRPNDPDVVMRYERLRAEAGKE